MGFSEKAKDLVRTYVEKQYTDNKIPGFEVHLVWFSKTLQNWKALVITDLPDMMFFEVTYNGDKKEAYLDAYKKVSNERIPD